MKITKNYLKGIIKEELEKIEDDPNKEIKIKLQTFYRSANLGSNEERLNKVNWEMIPKKVIDCIYAVINYPKRKEAIELIDTIISIGVTGSSDTALGSTVLVKRAIVDYVKAYQTTTQEYNVLKTAFDYLKDLKNN
jgi:hypothetical protein